MKNNQTQINVLNQYCIVKGQNYLAQALTQRKGKLNLCLEVKGTTAATTSLETVTLNFLNILPPPSLAAEYCLYLFTVDLTLHQ